MTAVTSSSFRQLVALEESAHKHEQAATADRQKIKDLLAKAARDLGIKPESAPGTAAVATARTPAAPRRKRGAAARVPVNKGIKVEPKYRDPTNPQNVWSGRGREPRWMVAAMKKGAQREDFRISA